MCQQQLFIAAGSVRGNANVLMGLTILPILLLHQVFKFSFAIAAGSVSGNADGEKKSCHMPSEA